MKKFSLVSLIMDIMLPLAVGMLSALLAGMMSGAYAEVPKLSITPPAWVFPVVWTILYTLMGISSYLVYREDVPWEESGLGCYAAQLFMNFFWSIWFFRFHWYWFSFVWLLIMIGFIVCMIRRFYKVNRTAALLQLPYLLWSIFAAYLNFQVALIS